MILLIIILGFFVSRLLVLLSATGVVECPPKVVAVDGGVVGAQVPRALLLLELLELLLRRRLLAREGRSIAAMTSSGFRFRGGPEKSL
jgi:hypothetical protein